jgi:hypothetical protein
VARQHLAVMAGLCDDAARFASHVEGARPTDALQLMLMTQSFDAMREVAERSHTNALFLDASPRGAARAMRAISSAALLGPPAQRMAREPGLLGALKGWISGRVSGRES